jgi:hypothetical protein
MRPELRQRILAIEDNFTERKPEGAKPEELRRTLVAFANSVPEGRTAVLFLGVANDGLIVGISNPDELQKRLRKVVGDCYPGIIYSVEADEIDGKAVIAVEVPASSRKPHFAGPAYVRVGSESVLASEAQYEELIASRHSKAGAILRLKGQLVTVEVMRKKLGSNENINDSKYRTRHECRVEDCTSHYIRLYEISTCTRVAEPLENVTISHDEK